MGGKNKLSFGIYLFIYLSIRSSFAWGTPSVQALFFTGAQGSNKIHQNSLAQISQIKFRYTDERCLSLTRPAGTRCSVVVGVG